MNHLRTRIAAAIPAALLCAPLWAQTTERVSIATTGAQGNGSSSWDGAFAPVSISANGRYVAFESSADNLVSGDTNGVWDVFVRDRLTNTTNRVSVATNGAQANDTSSSPAISADGRHVAFVSRASNLGILHPHGNANVFVHDRQSGVTTPVSLAFLGGYPFEDSYYPSISGDGRYVAFASLSPNLVPIDVNGWEDVFVHDCLSGSTQLVSMNSSGGQGNLGSDEASISADGRFVAFSSGADNLVSGDTNGRYDVFVHDCRSGATELVSVDSSGTQGNNNSFGPSISGDGRFVAFASLATNLTPATTGGWGDVFVRDRQTGTTELVSYVAAGRAGNGRSASPSISADGRYVAFTSWASDLVSVDTNGTYDVFVHDRQTGVTEMVSVNDAGVQGDFWSGYYAVPSVSEHGGVIAFQSSADNLVAGDTNGWTDVFVRDQIGSTAFASLCDPGTEGVFGCPCSNPPTGPDRGCDNSRSTGGASLSGSGSASLSADTLVFTTSGEIRAAVSTLLQGTSSPPAGLVFGQGVRCVAGSLRRLYTNMAFGGAMTAPDFGGGDASISARSATMGDIIQAGQTRWYLVYYRDPIVLGGCPATSQFNTTQTRRVRWLP